MSYAPISSEETLNPVKFNRRSIRSQHSLGSSSRVRRGRVSRRLATNRSSTELPILVHCHLCWDWVWQRPQQFISRLSQNHKVLFIETIGPDPQLAAPYARFRAAENFPNITLLRLQFPTWCWNEGAYVDRERRRLVKEFLAGPLAGQFDDPIQWFYDPMAVPAFAGQMDEVLTVYDCMDELSKFAFAPPELVKREAELLARADVVFAGGRKLCESKSRFHDNCHFYGCGVDWEHFGKALAHSTTVPEQVNSLKKPVFGYFGVVDERLDYELIGKLADENPNASVVIVGPVLKVKSESLPQRPNLHFLGQQAYADLPAFCKGFSVCLMPFALNEATEFINPTKALEYMASGSPIVSSAVPDVVRNFGSVVRVAKTRDEFVSFCRDAAEQPDRAAIERGCEMAANNSWESIVAQLEKHVQAAQQKTLSTRATA